MHISYEQLIPYNWFIIFFHLAINSLGDFTLSLMDPRQVLIFLNNLADCLALFDQTNLRVVTSASRCGNRCECKIIIKKVNQGHTDHC